MSIQKPLLLPIVENADASEGFCSVPQQLCYNYSWFLTVSKTGTDGSPIMKMQVSNNGTDWLEYKCSASGVTLEDNYTGFRDDDISAKYFRLCFEPNGTTTGTIDAEIFLKAR